MNLLNIIYSKERNYLYFSHTESYLQVIACFLLRMLSNRDWPNTNVDTTTGLNLIGQGVCDLQAESSWRSGCIYFGLQEIQPLKLTQYIVLSTPTSWVRLVYDHMFYCISK